MNAMYEDNNGGDILEIIDNEDGTYTFQSANCCVYNLTKTGTITEITRWLAELTFKLPSDIETVERW
jgi:hypothetical protein